MPSYDFIEWYCAGRRKIAFNNQKVDVDPAVAAWLAAACKAVAALPRQQLCTLHVYSTQMFDLITNALRDPTNMEHYKELYNPPDWDSSAFYVLKGFRKDTSAAQLMKFVDSRYRSRPEVAQILPALVAIQQVNKNRPPKDMSEAKEEWAAWEIPYKAAQQALRGALVASRPYFTPAFNAAVSDRDQKMNDGVVLYTQACAFFREPGSSKFLTTTDATVLKTARNMKTLAHFKKVMPHISIDGWQRLVARFILDVDTIFEKMPALPSALAVYRGTREDNLPRMRADPSYVSTSLATEVADRFTDDATKCCMARITVPPGDKAVPLLVVSRYWQEFEILLPRVGRTCAFESASR
jgi:hypothetical protein